MVTPKIAHVGEVGQAHAARRMLLAEDHLPLRAMQRAPAPNAPLQRAAHAGAEFGMPAAQLLEHGDRPQAGRRLQHRHDLAVPDARRADRAAGARAAPSFAREAGDPFRADRRSPALKPAFAAATAAGSVLTKLHEEPHLAVGDMAAGQRIGPPKGKTDPSPGRRDRQTGLFRRARRCRRNSGRATPSLRHADTPAILILIDAGFSS